VLKEQARAESLTEELLKAKEDINGLTEELNLTKDLKAKTEDELQLTLKKFKDFKRAKQMPLRKRIIELTSSLRKKNREALELKKKLEVSEKTCSVLAENNRYLAQGTKELDSARLRLFNELQDARNQLLKQTEKINEQSRTFEELNIANQEFRKQVAQLSGILTKRELELASREKETEEIKAKISDLEAKRADLENQLSAVGNEQKRAVDVLNEVMQLNTTLQEKLTQFSQPLKEREEKEKAEELKRKVEVILNSENP
jgi:chromosome segregation ATPase